MDTSSLPLLCRRKSLCTATQNTHKMTHAPDTVIPTGQTCHGADGSAVLEVQHDTDPTAPDGVVADVVSLPTHVVAQQSPSPQVCSLPKDFANALVLLPPDELLTAIQPLRKRYDPAYTRWMPHVNVLWPFPCAEHHAVCARAAAAVLENIPPFEVHLNGFDSFIKEGKGGQVFLPPTDVEGAPIQALQSLHTQLLEVFPMCADATPFVPHLTVAKLGSGELAKFMREKRWTKTSFTVTELAIVSRVDKTTPFRIAHRIPFSGCVSREE